MSEVNGYWWCPARETVAKESNALRRQLAQKDEQIAKLREACDKALGWAERPAEHPGHTCGPESNCDCICVTYSSYEADLVAIRRVLKETEPKP